MALLTVEGIYKDGTVELTERPDHVDEAARVLVTFLPPDGFREKTMTVSRASTARRSASKPSFG